MPNNSTAPLSFTEKNTPLTALLVHLNAVVVTVVTEHLVKRNAHRLIPMNQCTTAVVVPSPSTTAIPERGSVLNCAVFTFTYVSF